MDNDKKEDLAFNDEVSNLRDDEDANVGVDHRCES